MALRVGTMTAIFPTSVNELLPYVPKLLLTWAPTGDDARHMRVNGTLAFVDISGFTQLTERLARKGKVGAEEMSDILSAIFAGLLTEAHSDGADLVKWGGDAVLLLFQGPEHALRAARSAYRMRSTLRTIGRLSTTSGPVTLRMSVGVHSGDFDFFLVGDPDIHRELLISGPGASITAEYEAAAAAGQIGLSPAAVTLLPPRLVGSPLGSGHLLRSAPTLDDVPDIPHQSTRVDPAGVLPPPIRAHLVAGSGEAEHRAITVAFVQFSGTDDLLVREGSSALAEGLDQVVRNVQHACADHDVTFFETDINRDGGKIMLTAGAPRSSGHDEERMLRVARLVLDRAGRVPLRIGINRGHVFAGDFGPAFRRTYSVKGDAINLAARVMGKAAPGQALATLDVVKRSQTVFQTTELPPFMVKGKTQLVHAADIGALVGERDRERMNVPLIGRAEEMAVLQAALHDVRARSGRLVEIVGEPGIGKSRLVEELLADARDVSVVAARCEEYESSTAYFPFRRLLRDILGIPVDADAAFVAGRLVDRVSVNAGHLVPWLPLLGVPMDVELPPTQETEELDEQFRKGRLENLVSELLGVVLPTPTVIVVEDAHVMDEASSDLLKRLTSDLTNRPWLLLVTRREHPVGFVPDPSERLTTVRPSLLDPAAALRLVQVALDDHPLTQQSLGTLAQRGGGNPMFLEALVLEAGRSGSVSELPESVEGLVTSQIDRLDPTDRTVLRYAAVLGGVVDEAALGTLLDQPDVDVVAGALRRLSGFLVRERPGQVRFRHSLMRDVAYEGLPFSRRRRLHDQVGQTIERTSATPEASCELLSLHFFHAGRYEEAWRYSVLAGERARAKYANGDAIDFFERAIEASRRASELPSQRIGSALEQLGDVRELAGRPAAAVEAFKQARDYLADDPVAVANLMFKVARTYQRIGKVSQSLRTITLALGRLDGQDSPPALSTRSVLATRYAWGRLRQGRFPEAVRWAGRAARDAEDSGDKSALAYAYNGLHSAHHYAGIPEDLPYGRLALLAYEELGDLAGQGHSANNIGVEDLDAGRWNAALDLFELASRLFGRLGDEANQANTLYNQADVLVRQGRFDEAAGLLADAIRIARAVGDDELVALSQREQARVSAAAGRYPESLQRIRGARDQFKTLGSEQEVRSTWVVEADCLLLAGSFDEALEALEAALEPVDPPPTAGLRQVVHRVRGFIFAATGARAEAEAELNAALRSSDDATSRMEHGFALLGLSLLAGARAEGALWLTESRALLDPLGIRISAACPPRSPVLR